MEFRRSDDGSYWLPTISFNPCFSGYGIQAVKRPGGLSIHGKFQSLFFWIWNSDILRARSRDLCQKFQSLFFWIWNSDSISGFIKLILLYVSILVFLDMEFRQDRTRPGASPGWVSILVFLDMEFRLDFEKVVTDFIFCFNPCFSGYGIQTADEWQDKRPDKSFNPCFSGYGIQTKIVHPLSDRLILFQSLFFWIWNSDSFRDGSILIHFGFNPCFSGYGIQTSDSKRHYRQGL